jgi:hypothetical protein
MGVNTEDGRWAALVNVAPPLGLPRSDCTPSRGTLTIQYLTSANPVAPAAFARELSTDPVCTDVHTGDTCRHRALLLILTGLQGTRGMAGHTLLVGSRDGRAAYTCNRGDSEEGEDGCRDLCAGEIGE